MGDSTPPKPPTLGDAAAQPRRPSSHRDARLDRLGGILARDLVQALGEAAGVRLLGLGQRLEPLRELLKALVTRGLRHARIHLRVLVRLARDGCLEVLLRLADGLARGGITDFLEEVQVPEGVPRLRVRGVLVETGDVGKALDVRDAREVEVAAIRLRLAREGVLQVVEALGALEATSGHEMSSCVPWTRPRLRWVSRVAGRRERRAGDMPRSVHRTPCAAPSPRIRPAAARLAARDGAPARRKCDDTRGT